MSPRDSALEKLLLGREWRRLTAGVPDHDHLSPATRALLDQHVAAYEQAKRLKAAEPKPEAPRAYSVDGYAEIANATHAMLEARRAIRRAYLHSTRIAVPWDGAGSLFTVIVATCKVDERDRHYLGEEYADGLEKFFWSEWARKP